MTGGKVRLATFELAILLLKSLVYNSADGRSFLRDDHLAAIEGAREEATLQMRNFYKVWEKVFFAVNMSNFSEAGVVLRALCVIWENIQNKHIFIFVCICDNCTVNCATKPYARMCDVGVTE